MTPISTAAVFGRVHSIKILAELGADVDKADENGNYFHYYKDIQLVIISSIYKDLIQNYCNIPSYTNLGETPMHKAAGFGRVNSIKNLAELGADVNKENKYGNYFYDY